MHAAMLLGVEPATGAQMSWTGLDSGTGNQARSAGGQIASAPEAGCMFEKASDGKSRVYRASTGKGTEDWTMDTVEAQRGYHAGPGAEAAAAADWHESGVPSVAVARGPQVAGGVQARPGAANGFRWLGVVSCTEEAAGKSECGALVGG